MSRIRLLFDENIPSVVELALRRRVAGLDLVVVGQGEAPPKGTQDPELLAWCEAANRILLTLDRRTMPVHFGAVLAAGRHSPGVLIINRDASLSAVIDDLVALLEASAAEEWRDAILTLPL